VHKKVPPDSESTCASSRHAVPRCSAAANGDRKYLAHVGSDLNQETALPAQGVALRARRQERRGRHMHATHRDRYARRRVYGRSGRSYARAYIGGEGLGPLKSGDTQEAAGAPKTGADRRTRLVLQLHRTGAEATPDMLRLARLQPSSAAACLLVHRGCGSGKSLFSGVSACSGAQGGVISRAIARAHTHTHTYTNALVAYETKHPNRRRC